jgi:hypothetical protein
MEHRVTTPNPRSAPSGIPLGTPSEGSSEAGNGKNDWIYFHPLAHGTTEPPPRKDHPP